MARQLTPPVTVVQGDEAPDLFITLQQDSTGSPYNLVNRAPYAVIVESGQAPENYIEKFPIEIVDEAQGQLKLSWVKDFATRTSYLDNLNPSIRYTIQIFLGSVNFPPLNVTSTSNIATEYFAGQFVYTGTDQESSPVYKLTTIYGDEVFLSRSPYTSGGVGDMVWVITDSAPALWDNVKDQDKSVLNETNLGDPDVPIWNFNQILTAAEEASYSLTPKLNVDFTPDPNFIIAPAYAGGKADSTGATFTITEEEAADVESSGTQTVLTLIPLVVRTAYRLSE
jgi:hypothetical protein